MIDSGIIQTCQECAKIVELEKKKMFCDLCESQRVFSIFFSNLTCLLKTSMRWAESVIFLYWVGPVPYLEVLERDQSKKTPCSTVQYVDVYCILPVEFQELIEVFRAKFFISQPGKISLGKSCDNHCLHHLCIVPVHGRGNFSCDIKPLIDL